MNRLASLISSPASSPSSGNSGTGKAAGEVIDDLRNDDDELVKRITESFVAYRDSVGQYMVYADNGQMNARNLVMGY